MFIPIILSPAVIQQRYRFICSSNNNISRITKMVKALCQHYSPPLLVLPAPGTSLEEKVPMQAYHPFPPPSILAAPTVSTTLRGLGFGYRADFIQKTANMLIDAHGSSKHEEGTLEPAEKWLHSLRQVSTSQAREELMKFVGVGRKVADCILLMSLDKVVVMFQLPSYEFTSTCSSRKRSSQWTPTSIRLQPSIIVSTHHQRGKSR